MFRPQNLFCKAKLKQGSERHLYAHTLHVCITPRVVSSFNASLPPLHAAVAGEDTRPLSARVISRFHHVRNVSQQHPNVCQYLDILTGHRSMHMQLVCSI